jgi:hypothetical protein
MVLEERYRHPKPLQPQSTGQKKPQELTLETPDNISKQESIKPPIGDQILTEPSLEKADTAYGVPGQMPKQPVDTPSGGPSQTPEVAPIFDGDASGGMNQKTEVDLPASRLQPLSENPLHLPAGATSKSHTKNQIWLAITLLAGIAIMAFLAVNFLLE